MLTTDVSRPGVEALARALSGIPAVYWWGPRDFDVYLAGATAPTGGGVYIFARAVLGGYRAIYVGETECFAARLTTHEKWPAAALDHGATHIHIWQMPGGTKAERLSLERDLCEQYRPVMNPPPLGWSLPRRPMMLPARRSRHAALARLLVSCLINGFM